MLANHGFINRDGKNVLTTDLFDQLFANFPVDAAIPQGAINTGRTRLLFDDFNGDEVLNLDRLHRPGPEFGIEHQSSLTRQDQNADDATIGILVDEDLREQLLEANDKPVVTRAELMEYQRQRVLQGRRETEGYNNLMGAETLTAGQAALMLAFGGNEDLDFAPKDIIQSIFFDERVPAGGYDPANFNFRIDFAAEPGMGVRQEFLDNLNAAIEESLVANCFTNPFLLVLQVSFFWLGLFGIQPFCEFQFS